MFYSGIVPLWESSHRTCEDSVKCELAYGLFFFFLSFHLDCSRLSNYPLRSFSTKVSSRKAGVFRQIVGWWCVCVSALRHNMNFKAVLNKSIKLRAGSISLIYMAWENGNRIQALITHLLFFTVIRWLTKVLYEQLVRHNNRHYETGTLVRCSH